MQEGKTLTTIVRKPTLSHPGDTHQQKILNAWNSLDDCFEMLVADTPELLEQVYRLRFQVYCWEKDYENPVDSEYGHEQDVWDRQSRHLLIRHRGSATALATARLILMSGNDRQELFPVERHIGLDAVPLASSPWYLSRASLAEVSRFAISRVVRRELHGKGMIPEGVGAPVLGAWVTMRLVKGLVDLSRYHGVDHWYSFMEGGFFRLLRRLGLQFRPIGEAIEFHGRRFVSLDSVDQIIASMKETQPGLFARMGIDCKEVTQLLPEAV